MSDRQRKGEIGYRSPGVRCERHKDIGITFCNLCVVEMERDEVDRLTKLLISLKYCPEHGRVVPCEVCGIDVETNNG